MIKFLDNSNIFDIDADVYVNPVNCVGVMGAGLALQFKNKFSSDYFNHYAYICHTGIIKPGVVILYKTHLDMPKYIMNFPTKGDFKNKSKIFYIINGLKSVSGGLQDPKYNIKSIVIPALGCGYGGLKWDNVKFQLHKYLDKISEKIEIICLNPH